MRYEAIRGGFCVSADSARLDLDVIHSYLSRSYWAEGISREIVARSIRNSLCFGLYEGVQQIGFARVITDRTSFAYLCDVFVLETHQKQGLGTWLMECVMACPELQGLRRWLLATRDAQKLYEKVGFTPLTDPGRFMHVHRPGIYKSRESAT
jgi:GNAT superfamily N-acetyltransferase